MNTKGTIRIIKNDERNVPAIPVKAAPPGPTRWTTTVQSWVSEFRKRRGDSARGFDSIFK